MPPASRSTRASADCKAQYDFDEEVRPYETTVMMGATPHMTAMIAILRHALAFGFKVVP
jgi:hypothetical protein